MNMTKILALSSLLPPYQIFLHMYLYTSSLTESSFLLRWTSFFVSAVLNMKYLFGKSKKKGSFQQFLCSVWESLVAFCTISSLGRGKMMRPEQKLMKKYKAGDWSQSWCQETQKNTQRYRPLSSPRLCTGTTLYQYVEQIDDDQKLGQASSNSVRW